MKTIKKVTLLGILTLSITSCSGIYNCMNEKGNDSRQQNKDRIQFDIDTNCGDN